MILYSIHDFTEYGSHFANKADAIRAAKAVLEEDSDAFIFDTVEVWRHQVVPLNRKTFLAVLNSGGGEWSQGRELVATITRK